MKQFGKKIMDIMGALFGVLLLAFTGYETWGFLLDVTGNPIVSAVGLIMFEGGFLYWAAVFKGRAEGLGQMAISLLTSIADFMMVILAVALRLGAVDGNVLGDGTASTVVVVAVLVNLTAKYAFSLADPDTFKNIMKRAAEGLAISRTMKSFNSKVNDAADDLADKMATDWLSEMAADFQSRHKTLRRQEDSTTNFSSLFSLNGTGSKPDQKTIDKSEESPLS